jgi:regulator of sirC expression with transglutaminase-like and TPR domain
MQHRSQIAMLFLVAMVLGAWSAAPQGNAPPSLQEQLEAQYQVTHMNGNPFVPGTVLVLQKDGVFGVPPSSSESPTADYKNGVLYPPRADALAHFGKDVRPVPKGGKVYVRKIVVNLREDCINLFIIECGECNGAVPEGSYKSVVSFDFTKGYLQAASVPDVEDTIAQVFDIYTPPEASTQPLPEAAAPAPATGGQTLSNDDIIKLVQAKLPDSLIINNIRSSACSFDTSAEGLARLTQAGVSDAIRQAMVDAGNKPARAPLSALQSARAAAMAADNEAALRDYTGRLQQSPDSPGLYTARGLTYFHLGQLNEAISDYTQAIKLNPNNGLTYRMRADAYQRIGDNQRALQDLSRAIEIDPDSAIAHMQRAALLDREGDLQRELEDLDEVIRLRPQSLIAKRRRDDVARRLGLN